MFMHNGSIGEWPLIRRHVENLIEDKFYGRRIGTTDSEAVFLAMLSAGLENDPVGATARVMSTVTDLVKKSGTEKPVRFTAAILGNILMWTQVTLYNNYDAGHLKWSITAVQDQSTAGVIMMIEGTFLILGVLAWTFFEAAKQSMKKQELLDLAYSKGIELDDARAERAVKAGHGDLLEKRLLAGDFAKESSLGPTEG